MLVLGRRVNESIRIGDEIVVTVTEIAHGMVRLAVQAPRSVSVDREEVYLGKLTDGLVGVPGNSGLHVSDVTEESGTPVRNQHGEGLGTADYGSRVSAPRRD